MRFLIIISLIMATNVFASSEVKISKCKIEANTAAFNDYNSSYADSTISTRTKFKPIIEDNQIIYTIQILDLDRGNDQMYTVSLDKNNCKVISIN